jgi:hypothetical protein
MADGDDKKRITEINHQIFIHNFQFSVTIFLLNSHSKTLFPQDKHKTGICIIFSTSFLAFVSQWKWNEIKILFLLPAMLIYFISAFGVFFLCGIIIMWHRISYLSSTHLKYAAKSYLKSLSPHRHELLRVYGLLNKNISILAVEHHKLINLTFSLFSWGRIICKKTFTWLRWPMPFGYMSMNFLSVSIKMITNKIRFMTGWHKSSWSWEEEKIFFVVILNMWCECKEKKWDVMQGVWHFFDF